MNIWTICQSSFSPKDTHLTTLISPIYITFIVPLSQTIPQRMHINFFLEKQFKKIIVQDMLYPLVKDDESLVEFVDHVKGAISLQYRLRHWSGEW